jgi:hypothetical protein
MYKKYIVRLSDEERRVCREVVKKPKGSSQKVRRAQILLQADADGPNWPDVRIAEAFHCRRPSPIPWAAAWSASSTRRPAVSPSGSRNRDRRNPIQPAATQSDGADQT